MTKVTLSQECENDPNKQFIEDFNLAFAQCDTEYIASCFSDDAQWQMVGGPVWNGKAAITEALKDMSDGDASELIMDTIVSSQNKCAASGALKYPSGRGISYCDVYTFTSDAPDKKIKTLTAYAIET